MGLGLVFGAFDLMNTVTSAYAVETTGEGTEWGSPVPIEQVIASLLQDGSVVVTQGYDNRTVMVRVILTAADSAILAQGESDLFAEIGKRNTLTYTPVDGFGPDTVFEVITSSLEHTNDDLMETILGQRTYTVRLVCEPFSRSAVKSTTSPTPTLVGTARQNAYSFSVGGSAATEAELHIGVAGTGGVLGKTLIHTRPDAQGVIPLRQYRVGGTTGTTSAAANVSGRYDNDISSTPFHASVPRAVVPDGTYVPVALVATASSSGTTTLTRDVQTYINGATVLDIDPVSVTSPTLTTTYDFVQVGPAFQLPSALIADEATGATVEVIISDAVGGVTVRLDEAYLVEIETGALTIVDVTDPVIGSGDAAHVWVIPPSTAVPYHRVLRGGAGDKSDAFGAATTARGRHVLKPGTNFGFVVTNGDPTVTLDVAYWRRWHTHAGA